MVKPSWLEVQALLQDEKFLEHCVDIEVDPSEALGVATYSRADKCSHPIHLLRIHPETAEATSIQIACDSNNSFMCKECSEYKKRLRVAQMLFVLERPGNQVLFLTTTAPSFGKVHRSQFSKQEIWKIRHLDEETQRRRRLTVMQSREACPCGSRHTSEEEIIGTPVGHYDYAAEILWSANVPKLVVSLKESLKYWAKVAGIDPENFKLYMVYERQKRGSLHVHAMIVINNDSKGFETFKNNLPECDHKTPFPVSSRVPKKGLNGLSVGWDRYAKAMKDKRAFEDVMPLVTRFGSEFDVRELEADETSSEEVEEEEMDEEEAAALALVDELVVAEEIKNPRSYKRAAAYLAKYLSKNASSPFSPNALKEMSGPVRAHWSKFRRVSVLLFTDKIVFDSIATGLQKQVDQILLEASVTNWSDYAQLRLMSAYYTAEANRLEFLAEGVRPSVIGDLIADKLIKHALTVDGVSDIVKSYLYKLRPLSATLKREWESNLPQRTFKQRLNRLANNAAFSGAMTSTYNWGFSLKDMKENRKAMFIAMNPDVEIVEYIWELDQVEDGVSGVVVPKEDYVFTPSVAFADNPRFAGDNVAYCVNGVWWEKNILPLGSQYANGRWQTVFGGKNGIAWESRVVSDY